MNLPPIVSKVLRNRLFRWSVGVFVVLFVVTEILVYLAHTYSPVRVPYRRWKADSPYIYEEVDPRYLKTDPNKLITVRSPQDAKRLRTDLIETIWGPDGFPRGKQPASVKPGYTDPAFSDFKNLAGIDRVRIEMDHDIYSVAYHFRPVHANGRMILYHHGYAGDVRAMADLFRPLVAAGYNVIALNFLGYGENWYDSDIYYPKWGWYRTSVHRLLSLEEHPLKFFVEPAIVAVNYAQSLGFPYVDMIGLSAGGWTTEMAASVDPRIRRSYPVAGGYPLYLRSNAERNQSPPPQYEPRLLQTAGYLDIYVLGATGEGRRQLQIFNRFDRCCYRNTLGRLYEPAVEKAVAEVGEGGFRVVIDETHADHKISEFGRETILKDLAAP